MFEDPSARTNKLINFNAIKLRFSIAFHQSSAKNKIKQTNCNYYNYSHNRTSNIKRENGFIKLEISMIFGQNLTNRIEKFEYKLYQNRRNVSKELNKHKTTAKSITKNLHSKIIKQKGCFLKILLKLLILL